ncbi:glyoxalase [Comamonas serinivorans]|uniref:Glyoxalase n=1 Tax=Comamonas serinivorans TaxID=1082851 RepID=A0A1Y0EKH0_9BURK|nr:VOC family protein [Comamonas serinivorans]ARU04087.1 glyoxalase [Comamonas serinivorans]
MPSPAASPVTASPIRSFYPVLMTAHVAQTATFFRTHFDFQALFESSWYVHLQSAGNPQANLAVLDASHDTVPAAQRGARAHGLLLNLEVADVDAEWARLREVLPILLPLRSEAFGQRHFIAQGPEGTLIDVITPIAPSAEFAAQYLA